jgi:hypothetical protein
MEARVLGESQLADPQLAEPPECGFALSFDSFPETITYSARDYVSLLSTYSPTLAMSAGEKITFLDAIYRLIDEKFGGRVVQHYAVVMQIARRK